MAIQLSHHSVTLLVTRTQVAHHIMSRKSVKQENSVTIWAEVTICCLCSPSGRAQFPRPSQSLDTGACLCSVLTRACSPQSPIILTLLSAAQSQLSFLFSLFTQLSNEFSKTTMMVQLLYYEWQLNNEIFFVRN